MNEEDNYDDIIGLPHPVSKKHPQMPMRARAAQFAPFAALTGHRESISETAKRKMDDLENTGIVPEEPAFLE
ncbi:MAG: hypothetical protein J6T56_00490 [Bacteroidales bacterium]|nr:hypothetical protein [Bacteroidales bacterium]MBP5395669.1 hypothetical protein [Bacteroidales bacterium]MBP5612735.1 hypothetical protein [Bacteroidales bacterium]